MIYGHCEHTDGKEILNIRWPQRGLYHVVGTFQPQESENDGEEPCPGEGGQHADFYVWDDCEDDAVESAADYLGCEGDDDSEVRVYIVGGALREAITATTDVENAKL